MRMRNASLFLWMLFIAPPISGQTPTGDQLPDTAPLVLDEPLDVVMVRGINRFAERELAAARDRRSARRDRDDSNPEAYQRSIEASRQRLAERIGAVDGLAPPRLLLENGFDQQAQWDVLEGVSAEGLLLVGIDDHAPDDDPQPLRWRGLVIVIPDSSQTPEELAGFNWEPGKTSLGVFNGCATLILATVNRRDELSGHRDIRYTNLPHRELIYRCGFELGRHPVGYEVQMARQAAHTLRDWSRTLGIDRELPCGVIGIGDGGLVALHASALDPIFDATYVAGYFNERESVWQEPIDRNIFGQLTEFGDSDLASLIAPRALIVDNVSPPVWNGPVPARPGRQSYAAPGRIVPPDPEAVQREANRAREHYVQLGAADQFTFLPRGGATAKHVTDDGLNAFFAALRIDDPAPRKSVGELGIDLAAFDAARQKRLVESLVRHTQMILHRSDKVREKLWKEGDRSTVEKWVATSQKLRDQIHDQMIGRLPLPTAPLNPRSRKVIDEPTHTGWEVVLDLYPVESGVQSPVSSATTASPSPRRTAQSRTTGSPDTGFSTLDASVIAGGILLLPKDLKPGERRPVVVCQHGLEGTPLDTITTDQSVRAWGAYKGFSTQLVQRGFIVYAPQNPYRGEDEFRVIQRKSNPLGRSLFSYIIEQHRQTLRWLATLPYVDAERIAFYGLSYGGKTAVRVPPLLSPMSSAQREVPPQTSEILDTGHSTLNSPRYCLSICSADFNEWIRKNASAEDRYSYVFTKEYEMFEWNMGHIAGYAELSSLMAPRPFMVERGHGDGVAPDEWVGWEFAKVRRHYDLLGLGDRTEIEWFNGPHTINGQGTFQFLHRHLNWPEP